MVILGYGTMVGVQMTGMLGYKEVKSTGNGWVNGCVGDVLNQEYVGPFQDSFSGGMSYGKV